MLVADKKAAGPMLQMTFAKPQDKAQSKAEGQGQGSTKQMSRASATKKAKEKAEGARPRMRVRRAAKEEEEDESGSDEYVEEHDDETDEDEVADGKEEQVGAALRTRSKTAQKTNSKRKAASPTPTMRRAPTRAHKKARFVSPDPNAEANISDSLRINLDMLEDSSDMDHGNESVGGEHSSDESIVYVGQKGTPVPKEGMPPKLSKKRVSLLSPTAMSQAESMMQDAAKSKKADADDDSELVIP